jgi:hypothetical protein
MKRFFKKGEQPLSREEIEKQAAAELAAATGLGTVDPIYPGPGAEEAQPRQA